MRSNRFLVASLGLIAASLLGACGGGPADVASFQLPGDKYYPESLTVAADGTLFVGSLATGEVVKFAPGATEATVIVAAGGDIKNAAGVFADDASNTLFVCANDFSGASVPSVRTYDLKTGAPKAKIDFPSGGVCNDFSTDAKDNLYVADSSGKIYLLAKGASSLQVWSSDPLLVPSETGGFGADGIAFDGKSNFYVNTFSDNRLLRIPVNADGSAGAAVQLQTNQSLNSPDGMRALDANTLVVVEGGANRLTKLAISGNSATATVINDQVNTPTSVVKFGDYYYVTEGQLPHFLGYVSGPPTTPFTVRRVSAK